MTKYKVKIHKEEYWGVIVNAETNQITHTFLVPEDYSSKLGVSTTEEMAWWLEKHAYAISPNYIALNVVFPETIGEMDDLDHIEEWLYGHYFEKFL